MSRAVHRGLVRGIAGAVILLTASEASALPPRRVFIQLEPQFVNGNYGNDPHENSFVATGYTPGLLAGWATIEPERLERLLFHLREATVPYNVAFYLERPNFAPYDMLVFGTKEQPPLLFATTGCPLQAGLIDCRDGTGDTVSFVFYDCQPVNEDMRQVAHSALRALGSSWGLEELIGVDGVMGRYDPFDLRFESGACYTTSTLNCGTHTGCEAGTQDSHAELLDLLGPREDDGPPKVEVLEPANLAIVEPTFTVRAKVDDLFGGVKVTLQVVEVEAVPPIEDTEPPYAWPLENVPEGTWTLRVTATDADGNVTSTDIQVTREDAPVEGSSSGGESSSSSGGESSSSSSTTESSSSSESSSETGAPAEGDGGCGCQAGGRGAFGLWGLAALGLVRRRRRAV